MPVTLSIISTQPTSQDNTTGSSLPTTTNPSNRGTLSQSTPTLPQKIQDINTCQLIANASSSHSEYPQHLSTQALLSLIESQLEIYALAPGSETFCNTQIFPLPPSFLPTPTDVLSWEVLSASTPTPHQQTEDINTSQFMPNTSSSHSEYPQNVNSNSHASPLKLHANTPVSETFCNTDTFLAPPSSQESALTLTTRLLEDSITISGSESLNHHKTIEDFPLNPCNGHALEDLAQTLNNHGGLKHLPPDYTQNPYQNEMDFIAHPPLPSIKVSPKEKALVIRPETLLTSILEASIEFTNLTDKVLKLLKQSLYLYRVRHMDNTLISMILSKVKSPEFINLLERALTKILHTIYLNIDKKQYIQIYENILKIDLLKTHLEHLTSAPSIEKGLQTIHNSSQNIHLPIKWWIHTLASPEEILHAQWSQINTTLSTWTSHLFIEYPISEYMHKILATTLLLSNKTHTYIFEPCISRDLIIKKKLSLQGISEAIYPTFSLSNLKKYRTQLMMEKTTWRTYLTKFTQNTDHAVLYLNDSMLLGPLILKISENIVDKDKSISPQENPPSAQFQIPHKEKSFALLEEIFSNEPSSSISLGRLTPDIFKSLIQNIKKLYGSSGTLAITLLKKTILFLLMNYDIVPFSIAATIRSLSLAINQSKIQGNDFHGFIGNLFLHKTLPIKSAQLDCLKFNLFSMGSIKSTCVLQKKHILLDQMIWLEESNNAYSVHPLTEQLKEIILRQPSYHNPDEIFLFPKKHQTCFSEKTVNDLFQKVHPSILKSQIKDVYKTTTLNTTFNPPRITSLSCFNIPPEKIAELQCRRNYLNIWSSFIFNIVNLNSEQCLVASKKDHS